MFNTPWIERGIWLCIGILTFAVIDFHLVGKAAAVTCEAVIPRQKNFVFEIFLLAGLVIVIFSLFYLKNVLSPLVIVLFLAAIVGLLFLQNYAQGLKFGDGKGWTAEKVWESSPSELPSLDLPSPSPKHKWHPKHGKHK